jgi:hypothetical protein
MKNLTIMDCVFLDVHVGPISGHLTLTNSNFSPNNMFFSGIATCTKGSSALMLLLVGFISLETLSSMS